MILPYCYILNESLLKECILWSGSFNVTLGKLIALFLKNKNYVDPMHTLESLWNGISGVRMILESLYIFKHPEWSWKGMVGSQWNGWKLEVILEH